MFIKELSCLEVLLNHLINDTDLNREIFTDFTSTKTFASKKNNLFNIISIKNLLDNYREPAPFSIEKFVSNGVIAGIYSKPTTVPLIEPKDQYNPQKFIANIVEALRDDNYVFDDEGNVYVSSEKVEASLPEAWLYRLSEGYKRKHFSKLFLYNKHEEADISDRISLIDYLRHTKTFLVSLDSSENEDYEIEFSKAEALTNQEVKKRTIIRVEELIKIFKNNISPSYDVKIDRYKLTDLFFIVKRAEEKGREFYTKPLEEQKKDLNNWLLEFINSNTRANETAQEYLLLGDKDLDNQNKKSTIVGLINLYFNLLKAQEVDFNDISLTDFKIDTYMPLPLQESLEEKKELIQEINRLKEEKTKTKVQIEKYNFKLENTDFNEEDFKNIKSTLKSLIEKYHLFEREEEHYKEEHDALQNKIRLAEKDSLLDISFANNRIMELIIEATEKGRVYLVGDNIVFELYNSELGKTSFKATISKVDFLTLIENLNYSLKESYRSIKN